MAVQISLRVESPGTLLLGIRRLRVAALACGHFSEQGMGKDRMMEQALSSNGTFELPNWTYMAQSYSALQMLSVT
jgi:hypothetical protein